ncbi:hypothetical protein D9756_005293 [Leucocoprinus leucothites]|uniref:Uncharacterized protein n=1 Tax=Leucocoprinus leucothites TaxID=201217 RepID=A0A8H5FZC2_9AGAR|nr:hypothetical protein D9756_005293 [Leucoagaricus leucothites]
MKNQEESLSHDDSPKLPPYLILFNRHLEQLRDHLSGTSHNHVHTTTTLDDVEWEASEKDAFFYALSVHSRLRPDLIAASIQTKNEVEVLEYMAYLEEGLQREDLQGSHGCRKNLPLAHEVSEIWVAWEEENAERLRVNEEIWSAKPDCDTKDLNEIQAHIDESSRNLPLGGVPYLTYGHLVVLDSMLGADKNEASNSVANSAGDDTCSAQSLTEVGSTSPIRTLQDSASPPLNLNKSAPIPSQRDLNPSGEDSPNIQDMSPRSRRRYQKRMHMRRKRAQTKGGEVDTTTEKLRPGHRKKSTQSLSRFVTRNNGQDDQDIESLKAADTVMSDVQDPAGDIDQISEPENTEVEDDPRFTTLATRLPYQMARSDLHRCHVNAASLVTNGLDIFNHRKIGKLSQLYISGYDRDLISEDVSINTELLVLLLGVLKDFLVQTMSRVIVLEEEHERFRGRTKVWRKNSDEAKNGVIDKSAIQFALKTMGITSENTDQYFAGLLGEPHDILSHQQTGFDDNERLVTTRNIFQRHPLHQDINPPSLHLVSTQDLSEVADTGLDDFIDVETDDEMLDEVLHEEEVLDEEDILADKSHEDSLWIQIPLPKKRS